MLDAAARLNGQQRTLFQSLYVDGRSIEQAGTALNITSVQTKQLRSDMLRSLIRASCA